jgi:hypothetical protein
MPLPEFGRYGAVGFEFVASVGVGFFVGRAVDSHFDTHGVAMWIGFFLGVLSGFLLLVRTARELERDAGPVISSKSTPEDHVRKKLEDAEAKIADDETNDKSDRS